MIPTGNSAEVGEVPYSPYISIWFHKISENEGFFNSTVGEAAVAVSGSIRTWQEREQVHHCCAWHT